MQIIPFGETDFKVTRVCFGAWAIGGKLWGRVEEKESIGALEAALAEQINFFDTAPVYGFGHSEELIGKAFKSKRKELIIATKCGLLWDDRGRVKVDNRPQAIIEDAEKSLLRLQTDYIDLLQIHWPDEKIAAEHSLEAMMRLKEQGKIREIGVSNFPKEQLEAAVKIFPVRSLQPPYNLLERGIEEALLPFCFENKIAVMVFEPLCRALFSGKFSRGYKAPKGDLRGQDARFQGEKFEIVLDFVEKLKKFAEQRTITPGQAAIAWTLHHQAVSAAICGAKTAPQTRENAGAMKISFNEEEMAELNGWSDEMRKRIAEIKPAEQGI
jgi:aryl-alcohol dehydrogenase-like predicted oxidoreductase